MSQQMLGASCAFSFALCRATALVFVTVHFDHRRAHMSGPHMQLVRQAPFDAKQIGGNRMMP